MRREFWPMLVISLRAAWRHPVKVRKRKAFRNLRAIERAAAARAPHESRGGSRPSKIATVLLAAWRKPFGSRARKRYSRETSIKLAGVAESFMPKVSVIVPNYNHSSFLDQRIESILAQSYPNIEILILDDCSTDDSRDVINRHVNSGKNIRKIFNDKNSGNVFRQWRKGINNVSGDLIWICESDDFCEDNFLDRLVPYFRDRSVNIAFGRIQFCNRAGDFQPGLDEYRNGAESGIWDRPIVRPAHEWFSRAFGVNNVIANVGGCLFRKPNLTEKVWKGAESYQVLGDWFLYSEMAGGGQIAYDPDAVAYFRQHGQNTSVSSFVRPSYYEEHYRLMLHFRAKWGIPNRTVGKFYKKISWQYRYFNPGKSVSSLDKLIDRPSLLRQGRTQPHILIALLGFYPGGGELFPINLANELHSQGHMVSMFVLDANNSNAEMLRALHPDIPVYNARGVQEYGVDRFLESAGVSLIHSHMVALDSFFFETHSMESMLPYLVTLHGSYEACEVTDQAFRRIIENVSHYVYTADKNLRPFARWDLPAERFSKIGNAMPIDNRPFPKTRSELGIAEDAIVFTLVARGLKMKGWAESISAFRELRNAYPSVKVHLLLCGTGEETDRLSPIFSSDPDITFLGYQSCMHGLYKLSDCAIVPTRFEGESFPLCIIQALQTGTPVIGTNIGEIERMLAPNGQLPGGVLLEYDKDNEIFAHSLAHAMALMLDPAKRSSFATAAEKLGKNYSMADLAADYSKLYAKLLGDSGFQADAFVETRGAQAVRRQQGAKLFS